MSRHLVLHALAVKKHADVATVAAFCAMDERSVAEFLAQAALSGRVFESGGKYTLLPLARAALDAQYEWEYATLRRSAHFHAAYVEFETLNPALKALITDWQTMPLGGTRIPNDHSDERYDIGIINRLARVHEQVLSVLQRLTQEMSRFSYYERSLTAALERAEGGDHEWVSSAALPSYHTLWFELHEDLLRLAGRRRVD